MKKPCPNENPDCKYFDSPGGCYSDGHHIYGRPKSGIAREFGRLAVNVQQMCRAEHDDLHANDGVLDLPPIEVMKRIIAENKV